MDPALPGGPIDPADQAAGGKAFQDIFVFFRIRFQVQKKPAALGDHSLVHDCPVAPDHAAFLHLLHTVPDRDSGNADHLSDFRITQPGIIPDQIQYPAVDFVQSLLIHTASCLRRSRGLPRVLLFRSLLQRRLCMIILAVQYMLYKHMNFGINPGIYGLMIILQKHEHNERGIFQRLRRSCPADLQ